MLKLIYILPFLIFAIPLGLGNNGIVIVAGLSIAPLLIYLGERNKYFISFLATYILCLSLIRSSELDIINFFQMIRSGLPFFVFSIVVYAHKDIVRIFEKILISNFVSVYALMRVIAVSQIVQILLYKLGVNIGNVTFSNVDNLSGSAQVVGDVNDRMFFFPGIAMLLVLKYFIQNNKYFYALLCMCVLMLTGSKLFVFGLFSVFIITTIETDNKIKNLLIVLGLFVITFLINPLAFSRLTEFIFINNGEDVARLYQISEAIDKINIDINHQIFGYGFTIPIYNGVESIDPAWTENSRFDIENGYVMLAAKLGVIGVLFVAIILYKFTHFKNGWLVIALLLINSIGSGSSFFGFDGVYLILYSLLIGAKLK